MILDLRFTITLVKRSPGLKGSPGILELHLTGRPVVHQYAACLSGTPGIALMHLYSQFASGSEPFLFDKLAIYRSKQTMEH